MARDNGDDDGDYEKKLKDMTFKVEKDWHQWFKGIAVEADASMKQVFQTGVEEWAARRFMKPPPRRS